MSTEKTIVGSRHIEDLFGVIQDAKAMIGVEFYLTGGDNEKYALKWNNGVKELTMEDNSLHTLTGFVYGFINGRLK